MFAFLFFFGPLITSTLVGQDFHEWPSFLLLDILTGLEKGSSEWVEVIVPLLSVDMQWMLQILGMDTVFSKMLLSSAE